MIFSLTGAVIAATEEFVVMDVGGVGYQVHVTGQMALQLEGKNSATIFIYHHIREDSQELFGFQSMPDRAFFVQLISVSGVGPRLAMKILASINRDFLLGAILGSDLHMLMSVPGVGKKLAERLILELKDKLAKGGLGIEFTMGGSMPQSDPDLVLALKSLGYSQDEIKRGIQRSSEKLLASVSLEESLKIVLKQL